MPAPVHVWQKPSTVEQARASPNGTSGMPSTTKQPPTGSAIPSVAGTPQLDLFDTSVARHYRNRIGSLHLWYRSSSSAALLLQHSQQGTCRSPLILSPVLRRTNKEKSPMAVFNGSVPDPSR